MAFSILTIEHDEIQVDMERELVADSVNNRFQAGQRIMGYFRKLMAGHKKGKVKVGVTAAKATGTITLSSHVATNTVTVNGITFTAVASGATGAQYNIGADDTETASNLATSLNANTTLDGMIVATSALGVVTLTALLPGELGNAVTLAISANGSVSAARMAGGTNGATEKTYYFGHSA